jgi:hypothetical protein
MTSPATVPGTPASGGAIALVDNLGAVLGFGLWQEATEGGKKGLLPHVFAT